MLHASLAHNGYAESPKKYPITENTICIVPNIFSYFYFAENCRMHENNKQRCVIEISSVTTRIVTLPVEYLHMNTGLNLSHILRAASCSFVQLRTAAGRLRAASWRSRAASGPRLVASGQLSCRIHAASRQHLAAFTQVQGRIRQRPTLTDVDAR